MHATEDHVSVSVWCAMLIILPSLLFPLLPKPLPANGQFGWHPGTRLRRLVASCDDPSHHKQPTVPTVATPTWGSATVQASQGRLHIPTLSAETGLRRVAPPPKQQGRKVKSGVNSIPSRVFGPVTVSGPRRSQGKSGCPQITGPTQGCDTAHRRWRGCCTSPCWPVRPPPMATPADRWARRPPPPLPLGNQLPPAAATRYLWMWWPAARCR